MVASIYFSPHVYVPCMDQIDNVTVRNHTMPIEKNRIDKHYMRLMTGL